MINRETDMNEDELAQSNESLHNLLYQSLSALSHSQISKQDIVLSMCMLENRQDS